MARVREIQCEFYICEGQCSKGREGTFYKQCQICDKYRKKPGGKPARIDNRKQREERRLRKEKWD